MGWKQKDQITFSMLESKYGTYNKVDDKENIMEVGKPQELDNIFRRTSQNVQDYRMKMGQKQANPKNLITFFHTPVTVNVPRYMMECMKKEVTWSRFCLFSRSTNYQRKPGGVEQILVDWSPLQNMKHRVETSTEHSWRGVSFSGEPGAVRFSPC